MQQPTCPTHLNDGHCELMVWINSEVQLKFLYAYNLLSLMPHICHWWSLFDLVRFNVQILLHLFASFRSQSFSQLAKGEDPLLMSILFNYRLDGNILNIKIKPGEWPVCVHCPWSAVRLSIKLRTKQILGLSFRFNAGVL